MSRRQNGSRDRATLALIGLSVLAGALISGRALAGRSRTGVTKLDAGKVKDRGRLAQRPAEIPPRGLRDVFWRVIDSLSTDRVTLVAAGVTFYLLLAFFPGLAATVSLYGLLADPTDISQHVQAMASVLPGEAYGVFSDQLHLLIQSRQSALGAAFFVGLVVALWSAHNGTLAMFDAMNVAYDEVEKRGFVRLNVIALAFTFGAMLAALAVIAALGILPIALSYVWLDPLKENLALFARWPFLLLLMFAASTAIYRLGPSREPAKVRWLTWGAALSTFAWLVMTLGFSWYLDNVADYEATYGALGGLVGVLIWMWLSVLIILVGAELNAELEHQTVCDSTTGQPLPLGDRGAFVADHIGKPVP